MDAIRAISKVRGKKFTIERVKKNNYYKFELGWKDPRVHDEGSSK